MERDFALCVVLIHCDLTANYK